MEYAYSKLDPKFVFPEPAAFDFSGYMLESSDAWILWRAWHEHGVMAVAGGYFDQPSQWRQVVETCDAVYDICANSVIQEVIERDGDGSTDG